MRIGLIGHTGHWTEFVKALKEVPEARVVACCVAAPHETLDTFRAAPATRDAKMYDSPEAMLDHETLDMVQVATRPDLNPRYSAAAAVRGIAVMSEKPLAMDLEGLEELYQTVIKAGVAIAPMHAQRADGVLHVVRNLVHEGRIGVPILSHHQKSYKWRGNRPDWFKTRATFPGIAPYVGIHAFDWMYWILGDVFTSVHGSGSQAVRDEYPGCESQAGFVFGMKDGAVATATLDYLRPDAAPTHGDARARIVGSEGIVETIFNDDYVTLIDKDGTTTLTPGPVPSWYAQFLRSVMGQGESLISVADAFRITEIALKAQVALDRGTTEDLSQSLYTATSTTATSTTVTSASTSSASTSSASTSSAPPSNSGERPPSETLASKSDEPEAGREAQ